MTQNKGIVFLIASRIASPYYAKPLTDGGYAVANLVNTPEWHDHRMEVLTSALEANKPITPKVAILELNFVGQSIDRIRKDLPQMITMLEEQKVSLALLADTQTKPFENELRSLWKGPLRTIDLLSPNFDLRAEVDELVYPVSRGEKGR